MPTPMQDFIRGQRAKLAQLAPATTRFTLELRVQSAAISVFDFVCFGLDAGGKLSDDRFMVFFNQKTAPADAIQLSELSRQKLVVRVRFGFVARFDCALGLHDFRLTARARCAIWARAN